MIKFLKNFKVYSCRKIIICFLAPLIFLFLFLPLPALAGLGDWIRDAFYSVIFFVPTLLFLLLLKLSEGIAFLMGIILDWVISPAFIKQSYTRPCPAPSFAPANEADTCNQIIGLGLSITQSFVNLLLVVILVYIAFSIALRVGEHDAKKIFAKLIIVALLVNFVPVFLGVILDAANIIMNFFLQPIQGGTSGVLFQSSSTTSLVWSAVSAAGTGFRDRVGLLAAGFAAIVLNLGIAFAFFLFAGIFIFRYIAIWVLVILGPIAFVFWILPGTKKLWDMWWNNFIQWAFIGIPIAFFLYLGLASFSAISLAFKAQLSGPLPSHEIGLISRMFPFAVTLVFLFLGFLIGLSTSAMGAEAIIKGGKAAGMVAGKRMGKGAWRATKATGKAAAGAAAEPARRIGAFYSARRGAGAGRFRAAREAVGLTAAGYWARRKNIVPAIKRAPGAAWTAVKKPETWLAVAGAAAAVGRGTRSALSDMAQAGVIAGVPKVAKALGIRKKKEKKKGFKKCPSCAERGVTTEVAASAKVCPVCGYDFEEFEPFEPEPPQQPQQPSP